MTKKTSAMEQIASEESNVSEEQVADYLKLHPDFFTRHEDILADLTLPHESGKAISLLERQVTILRDRGIEARQKLNNLLENARNNDQLFDTTRNLVLALLRAKNVTEVAQFTCDQLSSQTNIDACEVILVSHADLTVSKTVRIENQDKLKQDFADVFRLKRTHCGALNPEQVSYLFPASSQIKSTALCPVTHNGHILALLVFGNNQENYFNVNLDTLFLDFIGHVVGAVLDKHYPTSG